MAKDSAELRQDELAAWSRLDKSREELQELFADAEEEQEYPTHFPRSKTMRMLTSGKGMALLAFVAGSIVIRPRLLKKVLRVVPIGALVRVATNRFITHEK